MPLKDFEFKRIQASIYAEAGIRLPDGKQALVQNRILKHVERLGLSSYAAYLDFIASSEGANEKLTFIDSLTTNETFFFRHRHHWDFFTKKFLPEKRTDPISHGPLRVWSAAASTGCEAYSAAIALEESMPSNQWRWEIEGTDLSNTVLTQAASGIYDGYALQKVTDYAIRRYFQQEQQGYRIKKEIRQRVRFFRHNLLETRPGQAFHLIFLRNVLFYFDDKSRRIAVEHVVQRLARGGYLLLGGAETLPENVNGLFMLSPGIYRRE